MKWGSTWCTTWLSSFTKSLENGERWSDGLAIILHKSRHISYQNTSCWRGHPLLIRTPTGELYMKALIFIQWLSTMTLFPRYPITTTHPHTNKEALKHGQLTKWGFLSYHSPAFWKQKPSIQSTIDSDWIFNTFTSLYTCSSCKAVDKLLGNPRRIVKVYYMYMYVGI